MRLNLKVLGLSAILSSAMIIAAVNVASATTGGHFVTSTAHTKIVGEDQENFPTILNVFSSEIRCTENTYTATLSETTTTEVVTESTHSGCTSTEPEANVEISMKTCVAAFTVRPSPGTVDNTLHFNCGSSAGPLLVIPGPFGNCEMEITPNQTPSGGAAYTGSSSSGTSDIVSDLTISNLHVIKLSGGFFQCISTATTASGTVTGKVTLFATNTAGENVDLFAT